MFIRFSERLRNEDKGFTLIELMVVVLIIAILIAIAIPTFLGARRRAQDRQAQSNLRNALTAEKTWYTDPQVYTSSATDLATIETNIDFTTNDATARGAVPTSGGTPANQAVYIESLSASGTMFCLLDVAQTLTVGFHGKTAAGTYYGKSSTGVACTDASFGNTTSLGWS